MDEDEIEECYEKIMKLAFYRVGVDPDDYRICFKACVKKAMDTGILPHSTWSGWKGHRSLKAKMKLVQQYSDSTEHIHCPPAPLIMTAIALKKIMKVEGTRTDECTRLMDAYRTLEMALTAIQNYVGNEDRIIRIKCRIDPWETRIDHRGINPFFERDLDEDSFWSTKYFQSGKRRNATRPSPYNKPDDAITDNGEIEHSETFTVEVSREMTRDQAENELKDILDLLKSDHTFVMEEMGRHITLAHMKVLSPIDKSCIRMWATIKRDERILGFSKQSLDDLDKYAWKEMTEKPIPTTWPDHPAFTIWNEIRAVASRKGNCKSIIKKLDKLRETLILEAFEKQENKLLPDVHPQNQIANLRDEITAIKENLESVQQQNGNLKRQNDEVIRLLKDEKRHKSVCVTEDQLGSI
ncbi:hypothetical protein GGI43DRAFT_385147 [Trichoderma evansii]